METLQKLREKGFLDNRLKLDYTQYDYKNDECVVSFIYSENQPLTAEEKQEITEIVQNDTKQVCPAIVKFNKSCFDKDVIRQIIAEYFELENKALKFVFEDNDIEIIDNENSAKVIFSCDEMTKQVLENNDFKETLLKFLSHKFFINFEISLQAKDLEIDYNELFADDKKIDNSLSECLEKEEQLNKYEVEVGQCFYGKYSGNQPEFISSVPKEDGQQVLFAGRVVNPIISTFTKKSKLAGQPPVEKKKFTCTLKDLSGKIDIVAFPTESTVKELELIVPDMKLCVGGTISVFNERINLKANSFSLCEIFTEEIKRIYRKVNDEYMIVTPQPVKEVEQMDLFSMTQQLSRYWDTHDEVVVFDLETTGFDANSCKIIEIGAVKVKKGSIIETFQTLINPQTPIPPEITDITHIDDSMVKDAPTIEQVLPDFYKFAYGAVLNAYNIGFDYQFLDLNGKKNRLLFDNEQIDTLLLARNKVPSLSNYKLITVAKALNVSLNNAHRALADAYATAKVFVKLI